MEERSERGQSSSKDNACMMGATEEDKDQVCPRGSNHGSV